ncbi:MAG: YitT family protein [Erysipelotrichaceae bacterium]|nr:YitT family protein [Erysipelotrichaceae bacterium]
MFWKKLRQKKIDQVIANIDKKDLVQRYFLLALGCFIVAFAFNVFFKQYGIVCFGVSGLSIVMNKKIGIPNFLFILIVNAFLLVLSYFALGKKKTKNALFGSLIFPFFVWITEYFVPYLTFDDVELLVIAIFGGVLSGIGYGLIFKTNFNTGGTDIITEIVSKYTKVSLGKATWVSDGLVVMSSLLVSSWEIVLYGFLVLYIISFMTDRVVLGISQSKAFYIVTEKQEEVRDFLLSITDGGVTLINARGGYTNNKETLLLGVVPTRQYFIVKEGLKEIDKNIFFLVCDAYEVSSRGK